MRPTKSGMFTPYAVRWPVHLVINLRKTVVATARTAGDDAPKPR
ncbi:hypothetical protein Z950_728 [Sulfitobacter mediterraneus KCTC 32188]|nr:hypothetical protein Z950_728 [Sulfitobacter mediterraneus KCTC 32188]